jgi:hypothetical protein
MKEISRAQAWVWLTPVQLSVMPQMSVRLASYLTSSNLSFYIFMMSRPAGHISVGSEPRRGRMKGQETRRRQQDRSSDQATKFYCSHRGIYVLRE